MQRHYRCPCGAELPSPLPAKCPQCGNRIVGIRRRGKYLGPAIVVVIFAALVVFLIWLAGSS
ncbi:MAG: hypothetical protein HYS13_06210 [Planctomycetia bacterium]|nr:hypothetical protein [Planctomycetia bacterium]